MDRGGVITNSSGWTYRSLAVVALGLGLWAFAHQARLSALPQNIILSEDSWPAAFADVTVGGLDQARFQAEVHPIGAQVTILPATGDPLVVKLEPAYSLPYLIVTLVSGLFFWSVAAFVFAPRVRQPAVALFFWISLLYGTGVLVGGVFGQSRPLAMSLVRPLLQLTSLAFLPAAFLHLSLAFPSRTAFLNRRPQVPTLLYAVATALVLWQASVFLHYFLQPGPAAWSRLAPPQMAADGLLVLQVVAGFTVLLIRASRLAEARERQQLRWLLLGFVVGSAPYVFLRTLPNLFGAPALFPAYFDRVLELAVPTGFVFAVVRYRFLNIDIILRRGLIYGLLAAGLAAVTVLPVLLLGPGWRDPWPMWWRVVVAACALAAGFLFRPLREIIGRWVDRAFFKIEHATDRTLQHLQEELDTASDGEDVAGIMTACLKDSLHVERAAVLFREDRTVQVKGNVPGDGPRSWWEAWSLDAARAPALQAQPDQLADPFAQGEPYPVDLTNAGLVMVHALAAEGTLFGAVFVGGKMTGRLFLSGDVAFFRRACRLAARRLAKLRLARTMAGERRRRRQMDELIKLKDDFLSRAAHDLRTPVTSLGWSVRNLQDGLAGDLNPRQQEYLRSLEDAVDHLGGLVTNLLEISRLEKSTLKVECRPCDPGQVLARSVGTVKPLADAKGVRLEPEIASTSLIQANEDKLAEVLVNILENAVRYSPAGAPVAAKVAGADGRQVVITIRDHGPGLGGLEDPFARFVQGTPSPGGDTGGYGLGLTIAREYVQLMGGTIRGGDHPDGGAVFTIEFPGLA